MSGSSDVTSCKHPTSVHACASISVTSETAGSQAGCSITKTPAPFCALLIGFLLRTHQLA